MTHCASVPVERAPGRDPRSRKTHFLPLLGEIPPVYERRLRAARNGASKRAVEPVAAAPGKPITPLRDTRNRCSSNLSRPVPTRRRVLPRHTVYGPRERATPLFKRKTIVFIISNAGSTLGAIFEETEAWKARRAFRPRIFTERLLYSRAATEFRNGGALPITEFPRNPVLSQGQSTQRASDQLSVSVSRRARGFRFPADDADSQPL